jgi:hypothetical protein
MPGGKQTSRRVLHPYRSQEDIADGKVKSEYLSDSVVYLNWIVTLGIVSR